MGHACKCEDHFRCVTKRNFNTSAFNGYHHTYSDYSTVMCSKCGAHWRTKASYVTRLPDAPDEWWKDLAKFREWGNSQKGKQS